MHKYELGNGSEALVLSAYIKAGFIVSVPFGFGASYDLVVDAKFCLCKIQVKTAWISKGCLQYKSLRRQPRALLRRKYTEQEADFFAICHPNGNDIYIVPVKNHTTEGRLRLEPVKNVQKKFIRQAADYAFSNHIERL